MFLSFLFSGVGANIFCGQGCHVNTTRSVLNLLSCLGKLNSAVQDSNRGICGALHEDVVIIVISRWCYLQDGKKSHTKIICRDKIRAFCVIFKLEVSGYNFS